MGGCAASHLQYCLPQLCLPLLTPVTDDTLNGTVKCRLDHDWVKDAPPRLAFRGRCDLSHGVARRSNTPSILPPYVWRVGCLATVMKLVLLPLTNDRQVPSIFHPEFGSTHPLAPSVPQEVRQGLPR